MLPADVNNIFTIEILADLLPPQLADEFFAALYGDVDEGAYDISLIFNKYDPDRKVLLFDLQLQERPGKCLACNLTYGLPAVFSRHPVLNIKGMVEKIELLLGGAVQFTGWELGRTEIHSGGMHTIPLTIQVG